MKRRGLVSLIFLLVLLSHQISAQTLSTYKSDVSVLETTKAVEDMVKKKGLVYFETVAHDEIAAERGEKIPQIREVLFEDADLSTNLIKCQPTTALDLPLKILIWEEHGDVYLGYIDPQFMKKRFMLQDCGDIVDDMARSLARLAVDTMRAIQAKD